MDEQVNKILAAYGRGFDRAVDTIKKRIKYCIGMYSRMPERRQACRELLLWIEGQTKESESIFDKEYEDPCALEHE